MQRTLTMARQATATMAPMSRLQLVSSSRRLVDIRTKATPTKRTTDMSTVALASRRHCPHFQASCLCLMDRLHRHRQAVPRPFDRYAPVFPFFQAHLCNRCHSVRFFFFILLLRSTDIWCVGYCAAFGSDQPTGFDGHSWIAKGGRRNSSSHLIHASRSFPCFQVVLTVIWK